MTLEPHDESPSGASRVHPALAAALEKRGYDVLTPVQEAMAKPESEDADLLVSARTGSGKTVAFGLAIAKTLLGEETRFGRAARPAALVVAPTRELALQVMREISWLYAEAGGIVVSCVGGMDPRAERRNLERGAHIVVGTPGRLRDHITRGALDPSALRAAVLDEADEMLDLGFREDLEFILDAAPAERRTLLFSATVPRGIAALADRYQRKALRIEMRGEERQHSDIEYRVLVTAPRERDHAVVNVLRFHEAAKALVFCNTRAAVNHLRARLENRGFSVVALSGELSQNERTHALQALRDGRARVCVATDVAARGIDLPDLELVVHADLPTDPATLLHRSGRTGRAGRKGVSALVIERRGISRADRLLHAAGIEASWGGPPTADEVIAQDETRLMADPILTDEETPEEIAFAERLLAAHAPSRIAAAYLRLSRASASAPEDVRPVDFDPPRRRPPGRAQDRGAGRDAAPRSKSRETFEDGVWISLSVGREQNAEPRWIIPMLCNGSDLTKGDIGAIKIARRETRIRLEATAAEAFLNKIGPNGTLEKNVRVRIAPDRSDADDRPAAPRTEPEGGARTFAGAKTGKTGKTGKTATTGKPKKPKRKNKD